jgi:pimeloyl-ACP methyl ester carboxylesterase
MKPKSMSSHSFVFRRFGISLLLVALWCVQGVSAQALLPQTISTPFNYVSTNGTIYGTLEEPQIAGQARIPVVLLIAGSGPTDRDGNNIMAGSNNSLKLLADALVKRGIAVVRYDKRGIAASAKAMVSESDLRFETYIDDAVGIIRQLQSNARYSSITVVGHSEGSLIGMVTAQKADIQGFVSLAGAGFPAGQILRKQLAKQLSPSVMQECEKLLSELEAGKTTSTTPPMMLASLFRPSVQPYMISWLRYDPREEIKHLACPVMIAQGMTDIQVGVEDAQSLAAANPKASMVLVNGMNHVLKAVSADMKEQIASYGNPMLPVVPTLVDGIAKFVQALSK